MRTRKNILHISGTCFQQILLLFFISIDLLDTTAKSDEFLKEMLLCNYWHIAGVLVKTRI